jgi:integration host factor alpha subunit
VKDKVTLTKAELADLMFEKVGLNKREAKDMVESFFEEIRIALERGEMVKLSGFGNFQLRKKPQRPGRNPKTGRDPDHRPPRGHVPREPEAEEPGGEVIQWPRRTWRRLTFRPSPPSAISPSAKLASCAG